MHGILQKFLGNLIYDYPVRNYQEIYLFLEMLIFY